MTTARDGTPNYYAKLAIEPVDFISENNIQWHEGNIIKYVVRWRDKNGIEDLLKAKVYLDMLIEKESNK